MNFKMLQEGNGKFTMSINLSEDAERFMKVFEKYNLCEDCLFKLKISFLKEQQEIIKTTLQNIGACKIKD